MVILLEHKEQREANKGSIAFVVGISKEGKFYGLHERWRPFVYLSKIWFFFLREGGGSELKIDSLGWQRPFDGFLSCNCKLQA